MCSTVQEQITTCGQNAIVKIGERANIRPQKAWLLNEPKSRWAQNYSILCRSRSSDFLKMICQVSHQTALFRNKKKTHGKSNQLRDCLKIYSGAFKLFSEGKVNHQ